MYFVLERDGVEGRYWSKDQPGGPDGVDYVCELQLAQWFSLRFTDGTLVTTPELPKLKGWHLRQIELRLK